MKLVTVRSKYGAKKTVIDEITFDSKAESQFYMHLKQLQSAGVVSGFEMQVPFILQEGFDHPTRKIKSGKPSRVPAIKYVTDFVVTYADGSEKVIDVKGVQTTDFKLKARMFVKKYCKPLYLAKKQGRNWKIEEF